MSRRWSVTQDDGSEALEVVEQARGVLFDA
jgi:hypothetical protein